MPFAITSDATLAVSGECRHEGIRTHTNQTHTQHTLHASNHSVDLISADERAPDYIGDPLHHLIACVTDRVEP